MRTKLIVTNKTAMQGKYSDKWDSIKLLLDCLIEHDLTRGITTQIIYLDDPVKMQGHQVINPTNEKQNKDAIDFIYENKKATYLILLGAWDIIPFQKLIDPLKAGGIMPSDLPYACSIPYSKDSNNFTTVDRIVSRLPDVVGNKEKGFDVLVRSLNAILHPKRKPKSYFATPWAVCTTKRKIAMEKTLCDMYGIKDSSSLYSIAPPNGPIWKLSWYERSVHYHILHGGQGKNILFGEGKEGTHPEAIKSSSVDGNLDVETIVLAMSCFGSQLYAPALGQTLPLANMYFYSHATAMVGCLEQTYSIPDEQGGGKTLGDCILSEFFANLNNHSIGEAFLMARQKMKNDNLLNLPTELRMFATFVLYGDASLIPMADESFDEIDDDDSGIATANRNTDNSNQVTYHISSAIPDNALGNAYKEARKEIETYLAKHYECAKIIDVICNKVTTEDAIDQEVMVYTAICKIYDTDNFFTFIEKAGVVEFKQQYTANNEVLL